MSIHVDLKYDPELNIVFTLDEGDLKTQEDVDTFFDEYRKFFQELGKKAYMVSNIDNLLVHPEVAEYYGEVARATIADNLLGFARWGTKDWARLTVRTTSLKAKIPPNIYNTKEEAVQAIEAMKTAVSETNKGADQ
jgi:hypothetical protein